MDMDMEMKKLDMEMEMKKMDMDMKKMDIDVEMKKMDVEMKKIRSGEAKDDKLLITQRMTALAFFIAAIFFSISIRDGLLGNKANSFLEGLQTQVTKNKLFLSAWVGASIADKVSIFFNRVWKFAVFLKMSLPVPKLF